MLDLAGFRTVLAVPLLKDNELIGSININRQEPASQFAKALRLCAPPRLFAHPHTFGRVYPGRTE